MPELPEVETIVRYLKPKIRGKRILDVWADVPRLFRTTKFQKSDFPWKSDFSRSLRRRKILNVRRAGKNVVFELSNGHDLYIHLMMTGKLLFFPQVPKEKHVHFWMKFGPKDFLALHDIRKFGWIRFAPQRPVLSIGKDALSISFAEFKEIFKKRKGGVKSLFLNQSAISGVGNIYSDEILWYAGIGLSRRADSLKEEELKKIYLAMRRVLSSAIRAGGTSSRDYRRPDGSEGGYYKIRKAYQRTGERCERRDGGIIKRIVIGQRSAHYCPKHQK